MCVCVHVQFALGSTIYVHDVIVRSQEAKTCVSTTSSATLGVVLELEFETILRLRFNDGPSACGVCGVSGVCGVCGVIVSCVCGVIVFCVCGVIASCVCGVIAVTIVSYVCGVIDVTIVSGDIVVTISSCDKNSSDCSSGGAGITLTYFRIC